MKKISLIFILIFFIYSCSSKEMIYKNDIQIHQIPILSVQIRADTTHEEVFRINFRIPFEIKNETDDICYLSDISYYYREDREKYNSYGWFGTFFIYNTDNKLATISGVLQDNPIIKKKMRSIYIYTVHDLDSFQQKKYIFKKYIDTMKILQQDTLSLPYNEFKENYPDLTSFLLEKDSISFMFKKNLEKNFFDRQNDTIITVPIKY